MESDETATELCEHYQENCPWWADGGDCAGCPVGNKKCPFTRIEAAYRREDSAWRSAVLDFCDAFTMVYEPPFNDCPALLAGAFQVLCDRLGIEQVKIGGEDGK